MPIRNVALVIIWNTVGISLLTFSLLLWALGFASYLSSDESLANIFHPLGRFFLVGGSVTFIPGICFLLLPSRMIRWKKTKALPLGPELAPYIEHTVKNNPFASIAISFLFGLTFGSLMSTRSASSQNNMSPPPKKRSFIASLLGLAFRQFFLEAIRVICENTSKKHPTPHEQESGSLYLEQRDRSRETH